MRRAAVSATVMKFGGTSVADAPAIARLVEIVRGEAERSGTPPVVVVSAMSGVTDRLLALAGQAEGLRSTSAPVAVAGDAISPDSRQEIGDPRRIAAARGVDELRQRHRDAVSTLIEGAARSGLLEQLDAHFEELRAMLAAVAILREASPRSLDGIAACGELLSSRLVAAALHQAGIPSAWIDARRVMITDDAYTGAAPQPDAIREAVHREIVRELVAGHVPVIGGFVGATADGVTTTLGRGGSDYSAAILGAALCGVAGPAEAGHYRDGLADAGASQDSPADAGHHRDSPPDAGHYGSVRLQADVTCREIQIWTDVDGMLTADPRIVAAPRLVTHLSFGEASELAYFGAKVLHPSTILPAIAVNLPVRILNSRRPDGEGTLITADPPPGGRPLAALACKRNVTVIDVTSTRMLMAHGFLRRLFEVFERYRTSVDVVTTSEVSVSVTVDDDRHLDAIAQALRQFAEVGVERDLALLCAVGETLRAQPALAVRILASLEGFPLRMVSQAASRRNVTVVLPARDVPAAMSRLHEAWFGGIDRPQAQAVAAGS